MLFVLSIFFYFTKSEKHTDISIRKTAPWHMLFTVFVYFIFVVVFSFGNTHQKFKSQKVYFCSTTLYSICVFSHVLYITSQPKSTSGANSFHHNNFPRAIVMFCSENFNRIAFNAKPFRTKDRRKLIHPGRTVEICCLDSVSSTLSGHRKHVCLQHIQNVCLI